MQTTLKLLLVMRTTFTYIKKPDELKKYVDDCINTGSIESLFEDPNIPTSFYDDGRAVSLALQKAINRRTASPTKGSFETVGNRMTSAVTWLHGYADRVEVISNDDANCSTRQEIGANISSSFLTHHKLVSGRKGNPPTPEFVAKNVGSGEVDVDILNGADYTPEKTVFIAIELSAKATLALAKGILNINQEEKGQTMVMVATKKGKLTHFVGLKPGVQYAIYAYSQNGFKQTSELSLPVLVKG
ncbi:MAG: hypothetical protein WCL14_00100 [Bacteroidota bacterium]